jgi:general secretion pathway protein N
MAQLRRRDAPARPAPASSLTTGRLVALGLLAVAVFAIAALPARLASSRLAARQISAAGYAGTIWAGSATGVALRGVPVGDLRWHLQAAGLLRLRLAVDVDLKRADGSASGTFAVSAAGSPAIEGLEFDLPIEALESFAPGLPHGWRGRARGKFEELRLSGGWPERVRGTLDLSGLQSPPAGAGALGDYRATFPDPAAPAGAGVTARVMDRGGPLRLDARLTLSPGRSFLLEGTVAAGPGAPARIERAMQFLGPPDASGRREFSVSGTL